MRIKIPKPGVLGLHIDDWRLGQEEAIDLLVNGTKRVTALCAPTGFGKSPVVIAAALLSGKPTCIVTATRGLQDQYMEDFARIGLVDIRGRGNYTCDMKEGATCEEGYASRCGYKGTIACQSTQAELRAATSNIVVTNYEKWCSARKYGTGMSHFEQVIFDEGHHAPEAIANAMQVVLHWKEINKDLGLEFLGGSDAEEFSAWKEWARKARVVAEVEMIKAQARITGVADPRLAWVRHFTHMRNLVRRLITVSSARAKDWVVEQIEGGYQFDPIRVGQYAESALLLRVPRIAFVSATLRPKTMFMSGIAKENFDFKEFDSDFDPNRCPIYYVPTMRMDAKNPDASRMWIRLDQVAGKRQDRKGIVHTVSFNRGESVKAASRFGHRMLINPKGEAPTQMIEDFKEAEPGTILVSPSVGTGYDFKYKACEWQFLCKIPFQPPSRIVKAREADDKEYRSYQAIQKMVQTFGRGMRSKDDQCENFIGDDHCEWFIPRNGHLAPKSFHRFYRPVAILPQPPVRL